MKSTRRRSGRFKVDLICEGSSRNLREGAGEGPGAPAIYVASCSSLTLLSSKTNGVGNLLPWIRSSRPWAEGGRQETLGLDAFTREKP